MKGGLIIKLTNEERMVVNTEMQRKGKSVLVSYLLLIFLGYLGIHRFYLNKTGTAVTQLVLTIFGWLTSFIIIGFIPLMVVGVWVIVDLFLVPSMVEQQNAIIEKGVINSLSS